MTNTKTILIALCITTTAACELGDEFETNDAIEEALEQADAAAELPPEVIAGGWVDNWTNGSVGYLQMTNGHVFCSGQLITPTIFLTAAHCVVPINEQIGVNNTYIGFGPVDRRIRVKAVQAVAHPYYNGQVGNPFDVGVVVLSRQIRGVPLARIGRATIGAWVQIMGYGSNDNGVSYLRKSGVTQIIGKVASGDFILAGPAARTCRGDSGGGAMRLGGQNELLLIHSYGPAGDCQISGQTGEVDPHRDGVRQFLEYVGATFL